MIAAIRGRKGYLVRALQVLAIGLIFFFLLRTLYINWHQISAYQWSPDYRSLGAALSLLLANGLLYVHLWRLIVSGLGASLSYRKSFRVIFLSQLGRYLPGKVWMLLGAVYLGSQEGLPKLLLGVSVTLQMVWQVLSGVFIFLLSLPFWGDLQGVSHLRFLFLLIPLGLLLSHPALVSRGFNFALRLTGQEPMELRWSYGHMAMQLLLWGLFWTVNGTAYFLLIRGLTPISLSQLPVVIGIFAISFVAGFLALFAPAGLGVVEGSLAFLLAFHLPGPVAAIVALSSRLMRTVVEALCALIAWRL